ncbi:uncharacterized protein LTR77_002811 [Saxophila tyrrhenica]|uniref:DUF952 domain protein n=1 Tax=Saxophila tyrrhenica TaxID=1690608 RepID=A0AAV9PG84_9PEZI|nr:hypothetical protein LTR77_002811 [Saxophila tyrrhenica]
MTPPRYLYKLLDEAPKEPLPRTLPSTKLDASDGFIHLSTAEQTPITAKLFFRYQRKLWVLQLERTKLEGRLEFSTDPKAGVKDGCAHLHDSQSGLGMMNVVNVLELDRRENEEWTEVEGMQKLR